MVVSIAHDSTHNLYPILKTLPNPDLNNKPIQNPTQNRQKIHHRIRPTLTKSHPTQNLQSPNNNPKKTKLINTLIIFYALECYVQRYPTHFVYN